MDNRKFQDLSKGDQIIAELYSRCNAMNGKYRAGNLGLDNFSGIKDNDIFFLETLKMKADLADKMIDKAEIQGKNTNDPEIMKELGETINSLDTPLHRNEAVMTSIFVCLRLIAYYFIAFGIWGLVFEKSFLTLGFWGIVVGILISFLFVGPVIAFQRTKEKIREMVFAAGSIWGNIAIAFGVLGTIALVIKIFINS
jgi:hypothetical protein